MDRFVPRDDRILGRDDTYTTVTARRLATRQSMDRFVPRDDGNLSRGDGQITFTARCKKRSIFERTAIGQG
jgi:hypothetical protein